jgi:hypothetical protein
MACVVRSLHPWWVPLVSVIVVMLAPAGASSHEMAAKAVVASTSRGEAVAKLAAQVSRDILPCGAYVPVGSAATEGAARLCAGRIPVPGQPERHLAAQLCCKCARESVPDRAAAVHSAGGCRSEGKSTLRSGRRSRLRFAAEEWEDRVDEDDDTELPVRVSIRDMVWHVYHVNPVDAHGQFALIDPLCSPPSLAGRPLRC